MSAHIRNADHRFLRVLSAGIMTWALALAASPASAQSVQDIQKKAKFVIGIQAENPPWGFVDGNGQPAGYDVEVATLMAKEMGVPAEFVRVTVANRIAQLTTGKVDALVAIMGMYPDRAKVVQFSKPYSVVEILVVAKKDRSIKTVEDLKGLRVGVPRSAAPDVALTKVATTAQIQRFDDDSATIQALVSGQVDAAGGTTSYPLVLESLSPGAYATKIVLNKQYNGITVRNGQKELNAWTNAFIDKIKTNGDLEKINQKWLKQSQPEFPDKLDGIPFTVE